VNIKALAIAGGIGAIALYALRRTGWGDVALGAGIGVAVQLGVRFAGVS
jgi:hypothetical protein